MKDNGKRRYLSMVLIPMTCLILTACSPDTEQSNAESSTVEFSDTTSSVAPEAVVEKEMAIAEIDMNKLHVNALDSALIIDRGRVYPDSEACVDTVWNESDIIAYYGTDLVPHYIPANLQASIDNSSQAVVLSDSGEVWEDTVRFNFYHDYYEDGSPKLTEDVSATKGFHLNASQIGLLTEFTFPSTDEVQVSDFGGTSVIIGYKSMPYGPYTEDTHEPSGYYNLYVAQFTQNGIEYEIVFSQIEFEEVIKVVASIIYDEIEFVIKN